MVLDLSTDFFGVVESVRKWQTLIFVLFKGGKKKVEIFSEWEIDYSYHQTGWVLNIFTFAFTLQLAS